MAYLVKQYHRKEGEFQRCRDAAKIAVQTATIFIFDPARQVLREYSRVWQLAPSISS